MSEQSWRLDLICCGFDDGSIVLASEAEAEAFRAPYTDGIGGHERQAILSMTDEAPRGWREGPTAVPPFTSSRNPLTDEERAEQLAIRTAALKAAGVSWGGRMSDRTVHVVTRDGREVVRYNRAGKYYIEHPAPDRRRFQITLAEAASWAQDRGATWFEGRPGGMRFDAAVRQLAASPGEES